MPMQVKQIEPTSITHELGCIFISISALTEDVWSILDKKYRKPVVNATVYRIGTHTDTNRG